MWWKRRGTGRVSKPFIMFPYSFPTLIPISCDTQCDEHNWHFTFGRTTNERMGHAQLEGGKSHRKNKQKKNPNHNYTRDASKKTELIDMSCHTVLHRKKVHELLLKVWTARPPQGVIVSLYSLSTELLLVCTDCSQWTWLLSVQYSVCQPVPFLCDRIQPPAPPKKGKWGNDIITNALNEKKKINKRGKGLSAENEGWRTGPSGVGL